MTGLLVHLLVIVAGTWAAWWVAIDIAHKRAGRLPRHYR